jgi:hypothetical protein
VGGTDDSVGFLTITAFEDRQYTFLLSAPNETPAEFRGYVASLKKTPVLNYQEVKDGKGDPSWGFARYVVPTPSSLVLDIADDELLKGLEQTPKAIGAALDGPKSDEIFSPLIVCTRVDETWK